MAVRLESKSQPDSPPALDTLTIVIERSDVIERSLMALTTELNRALDEISYMRMKTAGLLQEAAIRIADVVVIPARCESLSVDSVHITLSLAAKLNPAARLIILPTMYDKRLAEHAYNLSVLQQLGSVAVAPPVPARVAVLEAGARGLTIWEHGDSAILPVQTAYESLIGMIANPEE